MNLLVRMGNEIIFIFQKDIMHLVLMSLTELILKISSATDKRVISYEEW